MKSLLSRNKKVPRHLECGLVPRVDRSDLLRRGHNGTRCAAAAAGKGFCFPDETESSKVHTDRQGEKVRGWRRGRHLSSPSRWTAARQRQSSSRAPPARPETDIRQAGCTAHHPLHPATTVPGNLKKCQSHCRFFEPTFESDQRIEEIIILRMKVV